MAHSSKIFPGKNILALDIGGGTQDLLVWTGGEPFENALQCILPSPTVMVARKIKRATREGKAVFLEGSLMGGGASSQAIRDHLKAGLPVYAQRKPAMTISDNLDTVVQSGIQLEETAPAGAVTVFMGDIQEKALNALFDSFGLFLPGERLVAVQDHGFSPQGSNRLFRFRQWEGFLNSQKPLETLLYQEIPQHLTRMRGVQEIWPGAKVMDTGAAAILGAMEDDRVQALGSSPLLIINIGNEHTLAAWMREGRIRGIYEHHTAFLHKEKLLDQMRGFVSGLLTNDRVFQDSGHGCLNTAPMDGPFPAMVVTGPRRNLVGQTEAIMAAPYGNMMLSGCFGLLRAFRFSNPA
jgi:uncharacterized protein (DUF1786 family)